MLVEQEVEVSRLRVGMYVSRLDRDWLGTPFPFQGLWIQSDEDIRMLSEYCRVVFIDVEREAAYRRQLATSAVLAKATPVRQRIIYSATASVLEEAPVARGAHDRAYALAGKISEDMRAGRPLSAEDVADAVKPVVASVLRNPDAFFWITSLLKRDAYAYSHAVSCAGLAAAFGRHMGFPEETLVNLATGGFLLDIGKSELPPALLSREGPLNKEEVWAMRRHVESSLRVAVEAGISHPDIQEMILHHHERFNGSGYPKGSSGSDIPLFGRMAGIVDTYDAVTSHRPHQKAISRHDALQLLYRSSGKLFQDDIVEEFMQTLSVYPTGSLVELNTGQVGVVIAQNQARRLRPRVMLLLDHDKQPYARFPELDLMLAANQVGAGQKPVEVATTLQPGAYGLDPSELFLAAEAA